MDKNSILRYHADLNPSAGQQLVQPTISLPVQQRLNLSRGFVPAFLERCLADMPGDGHIGRIQFTVADNLHLGDSSNLFAHQLEDRAAEVTGNAPVGLCILQSGAQEHVIEALAAGGKTIQWRGRCMRRPYGVLVCGHGQSLRDRLAFIAAGFSMSSVQRTGLSTMYWRMRFKARSSRMICS